MHMTYRGMNPQVVPSMNPRKLLSRNEPVQCTRTDLDQVDTATKTAAHNPKQALPGLSRSERRGLIERAFLDPKRRKRASTNAPLQDATPPVPTRSTWTTYTPAGETLTHRGPDGRLSYPCPDELPEMSGLPKSRVDSVSDMHPGPKHATPGESAWKIADHGRPAGPDSDEHAKEITSLKTYIALLESHVCSMQATRPSPSGLLSPHETAPATPQSAATQPWSFDESIRSSRCQTHVVPSATSMRSLGLLLEDQKGATHQGFAELATVTSTNPELETELLEAKTKLDKLRQEDEYKARSIAQMRSALLRAAERENGLKTQLAEVKSSLDAARSERLGRIESHEQAEMRKVQDRLSLAEAQLSTKTAELARVKAALAVAQSDSSRSKATHNSTPESTRLIADLEKQLTSALFHRPQLKPVAGRPGRQRDDQSDFAGTTRPADTALSGMYLLSTEERQQLLREIGSLGRRYAPIAEGAAHDDVEGIAMPTPSALDCQK